MSDKDGEFADWISDINDLYDSASEAEILAKVKEFRASVAHELAEQQRAEWSKIRSLITQIHPDDIAGIIDLIDPEAEE